MASLCHRLKKGFELYDGCGFETANQSWSACKRLPTWIGSPSYGSPFGRAKAIGIPALGKLPTVASNYALASPKGQPEGL